MIGLHTHAMILYDSTRQALFYQSTKVIAIVSSFFAKGGPIPTRLNEVQVPIMNNQECERMFLDAGYHEAIPGIFLCAGWAQGAKDSCEVCYIWRILLL